MHFNDSQLFVIAAIVTEKKLSNLKDEMEKTTPHKLLQISHRLQVVSLCVLNRSWVVK